jgi:Protein of unknown function (DUF565)
MQRTRLSTLVNQSTQQLTQWVFNPWRRLSLVALSLLLGNLFATVIASTTGQLAQWDVLVSACLVVVVELISWLYYHTPKLVRTSSETLDGSRGESSSVARPLVSDLLNAIKIGLMYGLFVDAFKLGS